jgi:tRNA-modifying protein YgfZ
MILRMPTPHSSPNLTLNPKENRNIIVDLTVSNGIIAIQGNKAAEFLQGQLTCDVHEITAQQSRLGAHCDPKGRMQSTFRLFKLHDVYYLDLPVAMVPHTLQALKKYAVFFKITPVDVSNSFKIIGLSGPTIEAVLKELQIPIPQQIDEACAFQNNLIIRVPSCPVTQVQNQDPTMTSSLPRFIFYGKQDDLNQIISQMNKLPQLNKADFIEWKWLDIAAGLATVYPQTVGEFTPHHINYPAFNAVSFKKGCYTGQEIVARMQYLGKLKQHLIRGLINSATASEPGTKLYNKEGNEIGTIIDSAPNGIESDHQISLAVVADKAKEQTIHIGSAEGTEFKML